MNSSEGAIYDNVTALPRYNESNVTEGDNLWLSGDSATTAVIPFYVAVITLCAGIVIIILNIPAVITVFATKLKSSTFIYLHILSLSLTDAGVGFGLLCNAVIYFCNMYSINIWVCRIRQFYILLMLSSSETHIAVISLDRLLAFKSQTWNSFKKDASLLIKIVMGTFIIVFILNIIVFIMFSNSSYVLMCQLNYTTEDKTRYVLLYYGAWSVFTVIVIITCSYQNIRILWDHKKARQNVNIIHTGSIDKEIRGIIILGILAALQIVLALPCYIYALVIGISGRDNVPRILLPLAALACLCSACNPLVYSFRNHQMRETFNAMTRKVRNVFASDTKTTGMETPMNGVESHDQKKEMGNLRQDRDNIEINHI